MPGRCYVRNGVWGWSIEEQEKALCSARVLDAKRVFRDELSKAQAKMPARVKPEWLEQRAKLFRSTQHRRGETIYVATLLVLGISEADLIGCFAAAAVRHDTVTAIDSGFTIKPDAGAKEIGAAIADWTRAKREAQTRAGRRLGSAAAAEAKTARTLAKIVKARPLWSRPSGEISADQIAERVGLSAKTLYAYLGRREVAQQAEMRREKRRRKK